MIKEGDIVINLTSYDLYEIDEIRTLLDRDINYDPKNVFFDRYNKEIYLALHNKHNNHKTAYIVYDDDYSLFLEKYITLADWREQQINSILND